MVDEYSHQKEKILDRDVQNLKRSVQIVRDDHQTIQKSIHHINRLSNGLNYPESACSTFRIATNQLRMLIDLWADILILKINTCSPPSNPNYNHGARDCHHFETKL